VPELQPLDAGHEPAVLAFERANHAYFAATVSDRGDDFFDQFTERHRAMLAEQDAGAYYVLVAENGSVLGRFNLYFAGDGVANLGYRTAQHVAGRGLTTESVWVRASPSGSSSALPPGRQAPGSGADGAAVPAGRPARGVADGAGGPVMVASGMTCATAGSAARAFSSPAGTVAANALTRL